MKIFYAESTGGFYDRAIHGDNIPSDAVEITADDHATLLAGQFAGKRIIPDANGRPGLADPPTPSADEIWEFIKAERDRRTEQGGYRVGDFWFHSDQKSRSQQLGLVLIGVAIPADLQWKTMDGTFVAMTPALAQQILAAAAASDQAIFAAAEAHRVAMMASPNPAAYDYLSGWPAVFGEV